MSALLTEPARPRLAPRVAKRLRAPGGRPTLDDVMTSAWEGLSARQPVDCPVCEGSMRPLDRTDVEGRCATCHTTLR